MWESDEESRFNYLKVSVTLTLPGSTTFCLCNFGTLCVSVSSSVKLGQAQRVVVHTELQLVKCLEYRLAHSKSSFNITHPYSYSSPDIWNPAVPLEEE